MHAQTDTLLLTLFTIFVWAKVFAEIFERLHLPAVLGEILAGVVLGPYATGFVAPNATVNSIAEIGAVFLLFTVGLETSPKDLIRVGRVAATVAAAGVIVPFAVGFLYLIWRHEPTHEATFVAAAMVATSVGITARVLRDLHVLRARTSQIILGAAVFDDILGMVLLGVIVSIATGGGIHWLHLGIVTMEAVGFALFMIFLGPRLVRRMQPGLQKMQTHDAPLILALAICLGLSVVSTKIGMAAIIGAFFAGLAFADFSDRWNLEPRAQAINQFLSPFFFFTMGSRLDLSVFSGSVITTAVVISLLALFTKTLACGAPMLKEGWKNALKVGVGMTPRGEVALIVALIGLEMNMISQRAYAVVIFMTAVTTIIPPPLLKLLYRDEAPSGAADMELVMPSEEVAAEDSVTGELY
jgi:Kef-type K+ transport system membrane component KefB